MRARARALAVAAVAGLTIAGGAATPASAAAMDYRQYQGTYSSESECHEEAQQWIWPNHPAGADYYFCEEEDDGWGLYLYFLT